MSLLTRQAQIADVEADGRTLSGIAYFYDRSSMVSDGGPAYLEQFSRTAANKTIKERGSVPLGYLHPWSPTSRSDPQPLGTAQFRNGSDGLEFTARLSNTSYANEMLELVNDGAVRDVSIGFLPIKSLTKDAVTVRTEIALRELSLVPTGFGAHTGASVMEVRADNTFILNVEDIKRRLLLMSRY